MNPVYCIILSLILTIFPIVNLNASENLIEDPSFELTKEPDQFGIPFVKWGGWKYEGETEFAVGKVAHTGKGSALLIGKSSPKIRISQELELAPGRYQITAFIRGLDISTGQWNQTTEFMFNGQYIQLNKNGTFGWTKLTYVGEVLEKKKVGVAFGLMAPGYFWIDDVSLERVNNDTPLTPKPLLSAEEAPIAPPGALTEGAVKCPFCGYKNMPAWHNCYACGTTLETKQTSRPVPPTKIITSFEENNPFSGGTLVTEDIWGGKKTLRMDRSYISLEGKYDWTGYDYLKIDLYTKAIEPMPLNIEISDTATRDYWTRVNFSTIVPPGKSTLILPLKQLYVGEKSKPGRTLNLDSITKLILNIGNTPKASLLLGKVWLESDELAQKVQFDGLYAFDFGTGSSPVMENFTPISPSTLYSKGRGYGIKTTNSLPAFNVLQPDPLYQDYICMESSSFAVDLPNGQYRVFINLDNPSQYWGEYQVYKNRSVTAQGKTVIKEIMDFKQFKDKYFRFWNTEDIPSDNTFDKYQKAYFHEKLFDVEVTNGQLNLEFKGDSCANSVSTIIIFPLAKEKEGEQFLKWVENKRRFYFDNYFKRSLHTATGDPLAPTPEEQKKGYIVFHRDMMQDVFYNDRPYKNEINKTLKADSFTGQLESLTFSVFPLRDLGIVTIKISDLIGPSGKILENDIKIGYVSNRISRVTAEGSVYTINPRIIVPSNTLNMPKDITRRFWLSIKTPEDTPPGLYHGKVNISTEGGNTSSIPIELHVRPGTLDPVDIPVGPFGYTINTPWFDDDMDAKIFNRELAYKSLLKLREYGFTMFSGMPTVKFKGFNQGQPNLDLASTDVDMRLAKELGFLAVNSYGSGLQGLNSYYQDTEQMKNAGFVDYSAFIKALFTPIQNHAVEQQWLPIYWNLADEPMGDDLERAIQNAQSYKAAFPIGPPFFSGASSFQGNNSNDPHFKLAKTFHVANWNGHDEASVKLLQEAGADWAFYNGSNRWTYGEYLYKAAKQFAMKFRLAWHWNNSAGDPYYALDCREDDYAWCHATPNAQLMCEVEFERIAAGLVDYRMLLTLQRLAKEKKGTPAAIEAEKLIATRLNAFKLGQKDHDQLYPISDWITFRQKVSDAIEALRQTP